MLALVLMTSIRWSGRSPILNMKPLERNEIHTSKSLTKNSNNRNDPKANAKHHVVVIMYGLYFSGQVFLDNRRMKKKTKSEINNRNTM